MWFINLIKALIRWNWDLDKPAHLRSHNQPRYYEPNRSRERLITHAVQKGSYVQVYTDQGNTLFTRNGTLLGYTSHSVTVRNGYEGRTATTYNERGNVIGTNSIY